ncbi:MAG: hypothetical protein RJQ09_03540 [Cyclobacteriaceae bacterium]
MKDKFILITLMLFALGSYQAHSQFGVSFHHSNLPFIGINYEGQKFMPEFRIGLDNHIEDVSYELVLNHFFKRNGNYDIYGGLGGRINSFEGVVLPIGLNIYPFDDKNFGFHIELAGLLQLPGDLDAVLRGSWGIRYRFKKE